MRCAQSRRLVIQRMEKPLSGRREDALQKHLAACPACSAYHASLLADQERLRKLRRVQVPSGLAEDVIQGVLAASEPVLPTRRRLIQAHTRWIPSALALFLAAAAGFWAGRQQPAPPTALFSSEPTEELAAGPQPESGTALDQAMPFLSFLGAGQPEETDNATAPLGRNIEPGAWVHIRLFADGPDALEALLADLDASGHPAQENSDLEAAGPAALIVSSAPAERLGEILRLLEAHGEVASIRFEAEEPFTIHLTLEPRRPQ